MLANFSLLVISSIGSIVLVIWLSKVVMTPRYIEENVQISLNDKVKNIEGGASIQWQGIVRHRPPNQHYEYSQIDEPTQIRSYPDAPPGHAPVKISLTSDSEGYRNTTQLNQYDILVIGDSFAAGSRVSDEQAWPALLAERSGNTIYNLGSSGTAVQDYLSTLVVKGLRYQPKVVIMMVYEGNDFRSLPRRRDESTELAQPTFIESLKDSPVSTGLKNLSRQVFESAFSTADVPQYSEQLSWMPIELPGSAGEGSKNYYSFRPLRPLYLTISQDEFQASEIWKANRALLDDFRTLAEQNDFVPVIAFAPSKPHVVMPFIQDSLSAEALRQFLSYETENLASAQEVKNELYANMDAQEATIAQYSQDSGTSFISTTNALQEQTWDGVQTYYTYDQHWTPEGNDIVADIIYAHLKDHNLLPMQGTNSL